VSPPPGILLFVYGTLKRGQPRHDLLAGATFVGGAVTEPLYRLVHLGRYPGLVPAAAGAGTAVHGELWRVDAAARARLDEYEGVPTLYRRGPVRLARAEEAVETYFYSGDVTGRPDCGAAWPPEG
jgi:gamma-glutamylcyclotransferase (GGCT)/AIG2-like uncharacterized protein YtfP